MANDFKKGDVVTLKSSKEPQMTVSNIDGDDITCVWMNKLKKESGTFEAILLKKYTPPSGGITGRVVRLG